MSVPALFHSKTVRNLPKPLSSNLMFYIHHCPKPAFLRHLPGSGSHRSAAHGQGAMSSPQQLSLGAESFWVCPCDDGMDAWCDGVLDMVGFMAWWDAWRGGMHRVKGCIVCPVLQKVLQEAWVMPWQPSSSQICCPVAPSIPAGDVSTLRVGFATRGRSYCSTPKSGR